MPNDQLKGNTFSAQCPCRELLDVVANKWSALVISSLEGGTLRFGQIQRRLEGISAKVLTTTLRRLEEYDLVDREVVPEVPLHVEYSLTERGRSAAIPLKALRVWAEADLAHAHRVQIARHKSKTVTSK